MDHIKAFRSQLILVQVALLIVILAAVDINPHKLKLRVLIDGKLRRKNKSSTKKNKPERKPMHSSVVLETKTGLRN